MTEKRRLVMIGDFREMDYDNHPDAPSLVALRGKRDAAHKAEVVTYLKKAKAIVLTMGPSRDFFDETRVIGSHTLRTDGIYVWPDFTAGYVDRYDVALPDEFEQHMAKNAWKLPESLDISSLVLPWK